MTHPERLDEAASFRYDICSLYKRVQRGVVTRKEKWGGAANSEAIISLLNEALAIEIACVVRFNPQYLFAYAERIAARIVELGGSPNYFPDVLLVHGEYLTRSFLKEMVHEDLSTERIVVAAYREILQYMKDSDPTTRDTLKSVLAKHGEHIAALIALLQIINTREPSPHLLELT